MTLQRLKAKLAKAIKMLESIQAAPPKVINNALDVFPGDVWFYPPNKNYTNCAYGKVKSVNKKQNRVEFLSGWNTYKDMLDGSWILVARDFNNNIKKKVESL